MSDITSVVYHEVDFLLPVPLQIRNGDVSNSYLAPTDAGPVRNVVQLF